MYQPAPAARKANIVPHLTNQNIVLNIQLVVLYKLTSARYAAKKLMRGGMMVCTSHSQGLEARREETRYINAVSNARECARNEVMNE